MFFKLYKEYEIVQIITYIQVFLYFLDNKLHAIDEENMNIMWKNIMWMNQIFFFWGGGGWFAFFILFKIFFLGGGGDCFAFFIWFTTLQS